MIKIFLLFIVFSYVCVFSNTYHLKEKINTDSHIDLNDLFEENIYISSKVKIISLLQLGYNYLSKNDISILLSKSFFEENEILGDGIILYLREKEYPELNEKVEKTDELTQNDDRFTPLSKAMDHKKMFLIPKKFQNLSFIPKGAIIQIRHRIANNVITFSAKLLNSVKPGNEASILIINNKKTLKETLNDEQISYY